MFVIIRFPHPCALSCIFVGISNAFYRFITTGMIDFIPINIFIYLSCRVNEKMNSYTPRMHMYTYIYASYLSVSPRTSFFSDIYIYIYIYIYVCVCDVIVCVCVCVCVCGHIYKKLCEYKKIRYSGEDLISCQR